MSKKGDHACFEADIIISLRALDQVVKECSVVPLGWLLRDLLSFSELPFKLGRLLLTSAIDCMGFCRRSEVHSGNLLKCTIFGEMEREGLVPALP